MMKDDRFRLTKEDFFSLSREISEMTPKVVRLVEITKKIVAFVGATGSGKSTIISLLQGALLSFEKVGGDRWKIDHNDTSGKYPRIGH
jgi:ABC-type transport system involved in cytochrome bd biosynthesis fused ATPase/permease subunit